MTKRPHRHKGSYEFWIAERAKEQGAGANDAAVHSRARRIIEVWNARGELLYYPTFYATLSTGHRWLTFQCPASQQIGEIDLAGLDYHPAASISAVIPRLSCTRCCPNPPYARLLRLNRRPHISMI
jgi:hypothetical protein